MGLFHIVILREWRKMSTFAPAFVRGGNGLPRFYYNN